MKQLSALGVRRQFYRNPRRLRALRPGDELDAADLLAQHAPFNYFVGTSPPPMLQPLASTPPGMPATHPPPNISVGGTHTHTPVKRPLVRDYPGEPVPER